MALILPNLRQIVKYASAVSDANARKAIANLEDWAAELVNRLARVEKATGISGVPTTRTVSTTAPLSGGGALSADLTLAVADNSTSSKGVVAIAPDDTTKFWRGDATWAVPSGSDSAGALSIAAAASPSTLNMSDEGTIDWFAPLTTGRPKSHTTAAHHSKVGGGWIGDSFEWVHGGNSSSLTVANDDPVKSINAGDTTGQGLASGDDAIVVNAIASTSAVGHGFRLRVPALTTEQVLRIYAYNYSCTMRATAKLTDGSASSVSQSVVGTSGDASALTHVFTITFTAARPCDLVVTVVSTANHQSPSAASTNVGCSCITLGTV